MRAGVVVCVGEALIDMIASQSGVSVGDAPGFVKAPGGAVVCCDETLAPVLAEQQQ